MHASAAALADVAERILDLARDQVSQLAVALFGAYVEVRGARARVGETAACSEAVFADLPRFGLGPFLAGCLATWLARPAPFASLRELLHPTPGDAPAIAAGTPLEWQQQVHAALAVARGELRRLAATADASDLAVLEAFCGRGARSPVTFDARAVREHCVRAIAVASLDGATG